MKIFSLGLILLTAVPARAAKLDLSAEVGASIKTYENVVNGRHQEDLSYYSEQADINFTVKKINLEKTDNSHMDISIGLKSIGTGASTNTLTSLQIRDGINRYPDSDNNPFVNQAFVRIYNFTRDGVTATIGRQKYVLGQGIVLSDDDIGFTGARFELEGFLKTDYTELFLWRNFIGANAYKILGFNMNKNFGDGNWQLYHFLQNSAGAASETSYSARDRKKTFTGVRYSVNKNQIYFDGEMIFQRGSAENAANGGKIDYKAQAFLMRGFWNQKLPVVGQSRTRLSYGKSSGNSGSVTSEDRAFYPDFGHKYTGFERSGFGAIYATSLYDTFKTSNTVNGMPDGISGLNTVNMGFDFPYKKLTVSVDYFVYRAARNISDPGNVRLGSELDFRFTYPMGEKLALNAVYASFTPQSALNPVNSPLENIKLVSFNIKARF